MIQQLEPQVFNRFIVYSLIFSPTCISFVIRIMSGVMNLRERIQQGLKVGLGTGKLSQVKGEFQRKNTKRVRGLQ